MNDGRTPTERMRPANLARVLTSVHRDGPLSRAELTAALGLNRSTIGALTAELSALGLITESAGSAEGRIGRPSPVVRANEDVVAIAVNPEVDAVTVAAVALDRGIRCRARIESIGLVSPHEMAATVARVVAEWRSEKLASARIVGVGAAVPALVRAVDGVVLRAPHLRWVDEPVRDVLERATGLPAAVGNDATLGARAEHLFGAARGADSVVYLNGGASGIGGGLVIGGAVVDGARGLAGEFGHTRAGFQNPADRRADAGGALEDEVSRARLLSALRLHSADDTELRAALAAAASPDIVDEVDRQRRVLSTAVAAAVNVVDPDVVVLGGFLGLLVDGDLGGFSDAVARQTIAAERPDVRVAQLGDDRLLIGAAEAAFAALLGDPLTPLPPAGPDLTAQV